jgi:MerR family transcriptional regulator/heat shock protein HspR
VSERDTHAVYVISVAAELAGVHPQTLRIYERRGLLRPARTSGGNRRYSDADIRRLQRIAELAGAGVSIDGIRHVLELEAEVARLREMVDQLAAALQEERARHRREIVPFGHAATLIGRRLGTRREEER